MLEVKLFQDTSFRKEMFMRKQEVGCLAHNNRNVIQSIIDSINCTSTRVRDVALQVQGQAVAGELVTRGERLRGKKALQSVLRQRAAKQLMNL